MCALATHNNARRVIILPAAMEAQVAELAKLHAPSSTVSISTFRQLAALVLTQESRPPYSLHAENSFAHLQIRFGQHAGIQEQRLFKLSLSLSPRRSKWRARE